MGEQQRTQGKKRYLRVKAVAQFLGVSEPTIWKWSREDKMPRPIKLGPRTTVWDMSEVTAWVARKTEGGKPSS